MRTLKDKVVVITGGSRGIGAAIAAEFAKEEARVVLCGRDRDALQSVGRSLGLPDEAWHSVVCDLIKRDCMQKIVEEAYNKFGRIDIFVNNAGVGGFKPLVEISDEEFDYIFEVNLKAVYRALKELLPRYNKQGGGQVICISSMGASGGPGMAAYAASKAALNVLCESVAAEVRNQNIKICVLAPGSVETSFGGGHPHRSSDPNKMRLTAKEVAEAVLFMAKQNDNAWMSYAGLRTLRTKKWRTRSAP